MPFPRGHIDKAGQYAQSAIVLADTAQNLGYSVDDLTRGVWARTMSGLVEVDYLTEESPDLAQNTPALLNTLGIQDTTPKINQAVYALSEAMVGSPRATTIDEHYMLRGEEAVCVVDIFRNLSPENLQAEQRLWQQIAKIAALGIYVDSLVDAKEDAKVLPFSENQLVLSAVRYAASTAKKIENSTWLAVLRAAHNNGLNYSIARKLSVFATTRAWRTLLPGAR